ncbi:MAG: DUF6326 family protein [Candidatus Bathyarchaeota archaeon]
MGLELKLTLNIICNFLETFWSSVTMDGQKMEDFKINVKIKLSALWTALMFCFTYADILAHMRSDIIEGILIGEIGGVQITQEALIGSAILMVFPL